jgi:hypothetical protein
MEQPMTPSINRMIKLLDEKEMAYVTKEKVIKMEGEILRKFDFDFSMISPLPFLERFMRLCEVHDDFFMDTISLEILKQLLSISKFLEYRPSLIAAATFIVTLNLADFTNQSVDNGLSGGKTL